MLNFVYKQTEWYTKMDSEIWINRQARLNLMYHGKNIAKGVDWLDAWQALRDAFKWLSENTIKNMRS